jgi:hypothetical protein
MRYGLLEDEIDDLYVRSVGRLPKNKPKIFYRIFYCQAKSWFKPRRVVAKIEWSEEIISKLGFLVTNLTWSVKKIVKFYNMRGTAE